MAHVCGGSLNSGFIKIRWKLIKNNIGRYIMPEYSEFTLAAIQASPIFWTEKLQQIKHVNL